MSPGSFPIRHSKNKRNQLTKLESLDYREGQGPVINAFWESWREHYGESGFVNPRGDRLLTEIALRAMATLKPRLMMINYNDPDYAHWGNASHYTRAISIMDEGLQRLVEHADADPFYRGQHCVCDRHRTAAETTIDSMATPFQHHFNSKSAHQVFALLFGPGIARRQIVDKPVEQIAIAGQRGRSHGDCHLLCTDTRIE